jgi:hypothetical protein
MALVKNIAGFDEGHHSQIGVSFPTTPMKGPGLFSSIVKIAGGAASFVPGVQAVLICAKFAISLLPPGGLKDWLQGGVVHFFTKLYTVFFGRKFTTGNYTLAERYVDQVLSPSGPDTLKTNWNVTNEQVVDASMFFTIVFGVRITDSADLDALDAGMSAYYARPDKADVPANAVERAVYLKQQFYPISTYNSVTWDLNYFSEYPLVAPIPDPWNVGKLYNGPLPGGGVATDGIILIDEQTGLYTDLTAGETKGEAAPGTVGPAKKNEVLIFGGVMALLYFLFESKHQKSRAK